MIIFLNSFLLDTLFAVPIRGMFGSQGVYTFIAIVILTAYYFVLPHTRYYNV